MQQTNNIYNVQATDDSSIVNNRGSEINSQKNEIYFDEPFLPIESFKYFNSKDLVLLSYFLSMGLLAYISIPYNGNALVCLGMVGIIVLFYNRFMKIQEVTNVYNYYFTYNGILIPFDIVQNIKIDGNGLHLTYNQESLKKISKLDAEKIPKVIAFTHNDEILKFEKIYNKSKSSQILFNQN
jgi:hypothetical protein